MSFSFYKIIILNDEIEKKSDNRIDENVNFKRSCDFEIIFIFEIIFLKAYRSLFSSLKKLRLLKSSKRISDLKS